MWHGMHRFIGFFDHEIDEAINTYFNEYGEAIDTPDVKQSWEIDEPGYVFGDIYQNVLAGSLDNTNSVPAPTPDDVSWAMGWDFTLDAGETATVTLALAVSPPAVPPSGFYLAQIDPDSHETIYFSSTLNIEGCTPPPAVPEPGTFVLLFFGVAGLAGFKKRKHLIN